MSKTKEQKQIALKQIEDLLEKSKAIVFSTFSKIPVNLQEDLRGQLREAEVSFHVFKKNLIRKALANKGFDTSKVDELFGNIAIATTDSEETAPARILVKASGKTEQLQVCFGLLEGAIIPVEQVQVLATLPNRAELIAKVVGSISAPLARLVNVMQGNQRNLINVLSQIRNKK